MANISVIDTVKESYELIVEHWKEVAVPLIILLLLSGTGSFGGNSLSRESTGSSGPQDYSSAANSMLANAMTGGDELFALGALAIGLIALIVVVLFIFSVLQQSIWFYTYEHFYSLLTKKKLSTDWKPRFERQGIKAFFYTLFYWLMFILFFAVPVVMMFPLLGAFSSSARLDTSELLSSLIPVLGVAFACFIAFLAVSFFLSFAWIYYAMDGFPFFDSLGKSFSLARGNIWLLVRFVGIFLLLGLAAGIGLLVLCCFAFILSPIVQVFLGLLSGVTLMKLKLAVEKK